MGRADADETESLNCAMERAERQLQCTVVCGVARGSRSVGYCFPSLPLSSLCGTGAGAGTGGGSGRLSLASLPDTA